MQAHVGLTGGRDDNVLHVVAEDDNGGRAGSVLAYSDRQDAGLVAHVTRERLLSGWSASSNTRRRG